MKQRELLVLTATESSYQYLAKAVQQYATAKTVYVFASGSLLCFEVKERMREAEKTYSRKLKWYLNLVREIEGLALGQPITDMIVDMAVNDRLL